MNDIYITLTGNVAAEPRQYSFDEGTRVTSLKVLTSHRYFDRKTGQWADGEKVCFTVRCWRALGENVATSIRAGHPVVVSGRLRIREFGVEGDRRFMPEIEASAVGHDLRWGTGAFTKPERAGSGAVSKEMRDRLDEETRDWAMGPRNRHLASRAFPREEPNPFHTTDADTDDTTPVGTAPVGTANTYPTPEAPDGADPANAADLAGWAGLEAGSASLPEAPNGTVDATGSPGRKRGQKSGALRAPDTEDSAARVPVGEARGRRRGTRADTADAGDEQLALAETAAA